MDLQPAADFPLLAMACQGDKRAMEILIEFCGARIRRVIRKLCRKSPGLDVDDIFQETWLLLLKGNRRVFGKYNGSMGDLGAYLFGIVNKVVRKNQHRQRLQNKHEVFVPGSSIQHSPCLEPRLAEIIKDLTIVATASEKRFLGQSLLQSRERACRYSQASRRQLNRRLLDKAWPLVYGEDVPRPHLRKNGK